MEDDDAVTDAAVTLSHEATGGDYDGDSATVAVAITETDRPGLVVVPAEVTVEEGAPDGVTYTVALATEPTDAVTVAVSGTAGHRRAGGTDEPDVRDGRLGRGADGDGDGGG